MQTFIFGLLLASVSGVTVVAFRHPHGFARLFPYLLAIVTAIFVGVGVWQLAIDVAWSELRGFLAEGASAEATAAKEALRFAYFWVVLWYVGTIAFLLLILKLPPFLQVAEEEGVETDRKEEPR